MILNELLRRLAEVNVEVVSATFDGHKSNIAMAKVMGANFDEGKGWIPDPCDLNRKIYVLLDPLHMLKCARGTLGSHTLFDGDGYFIDWHYLEMFHEEQQKMPHNLGNKLTKAHMSISIEKCT